jgi:hypothetical protein
MKRFLALASLCSLAALAAPSLASAHTPTTGFAGWSPSEVASGSQYRWSSSVPSWLQAPMTDVLETQWASPSTNNSKHISFSYSSSGAGTVYFADSTGVSDCDNVIGWLGCAYGGGTPSWKIWIKANPGSPWCQLRLQDGCWDVERIAIHEVGHVGGYLAHYSTSQANSVMTPAPVQRPTSGWNIHHLQPCDEAGMQLFYDVASYAGPYGDCFDHIAGAGATGLISLITNAAAAETATCYGSALSASGRLAIKVDSANYGKLSGNTLASRTVYFDRRLAGTTTWTVDYGSVVSTTAGADNWAKSFTASGSSGSTTYEFRAHYKGDGGVDGDYSPTISLTWSNPC